jgi:hypothetical protein
MLSLLLQRMIETLLDAAGIKMTAARCLSVLEECRLSQLAPHELLSWVYGITRATPEQTRLVRALGVRHLLDERAMAKRLLPR